MPASSADPGLLPSLRPLREIDRPLIRSWARIDNLRVFERRSSAESGCHVFVKDLLGSEHPIDKPDGIASHTHRTIAVWATPEPRLWVRDSQSLFVEMVACRDQRGAIGRDQNDVHDARNEPVTVIAASTCDTSLWDRHNGIVQATEDATLLFRMRLRHVERLS